jgi:hypothetical protein
MVLREHSPWCPWKPKMRLRWNLVLLLFSMGLLLHANEPLSVRVHFSFGTSLVDPRFDVVPKEVVERELSMKLADACRNSAVLKHWTFEVNTQGLPRLAASLSRRQGTWYLHVELQHSGDMSGIMDKWDTELFRAEDISAHGMPMDRMWIAPIERAFVAMLDLRTRKGRQIFGALEYFVPLGATVKTVTDPRPGAVLPLKWNEHQDIALCHFRIVYHDRSILIAIHSAGAGGPRDFPVPPEYQAVWVLHNTYQEGALPAESIRTHLADLNRLRDTPVTFFLEPGPCTSADIAPSN